MRKCGFVNQKIRGRRPSNFLIHEFTLSSGFSGLNHKKGHVKTSVTYTWPKSLIILNVVI